MVGNWRNRLALLAAAMLLAGACQQLLGLEEGKPRPVSSGAGAGAAGGGGTAAAGGTTTGTTTDTGSGASGGGGLGAAGAGAGGAGGVGGTGGAEPELPIGTVMGTLTDQLAVVTPAKGWWRCDGSTVDLAASPLDGTSLPDLNGDNRFLRAAGTSGATGGAQTHTHTIKWGPDSAQGTGTKLLTAHETDPASTLPPYYDAVAMMVVSATSETPVGAVAAWASSLAGVPKVLPPGWVGLDGQTVSDSTSPFDGKKLPDLNAKLSVEGRFLRFADKSGGQGGAASHSHAIGTIDDGSSSGSYYTTNTGQSSTDGSLPPFYTVRWIARVGSKASATPPIGAIVAWLRSLAGVPSPLADGFLLCDGQHVDDPESPLNGEELPDLAASHRYLRGAALSGGTGGSPAHEHTQPKDKMESPPGFGGFVFQNPYSTVSNDPPYYEVVFIIRVK